MKGLYEVTAIRPRKVKTVTGYIDPGNGYIAHKCFQVASSEAQAIDLAKMYMPPDVRDLQIRATRLRDAD